ncbi:programmed cell death protein 2 [Selaginella moellendorffii]|uniref:programmed cell death protein 2 n=1 Tax=Selaginella moellendorffii TaxID=88036 RepID=UPI000D1C63F1|nr:programmed cell death protein 2 [Selaginella moellendorffii]|eukprot:XP_024529718.1 programmed cell death protein 2 [Selaginella moellendorffii]
MAEEELSRLALDEESDSDEEGEVELGFVQAPEAPWMLRRQHFPCKAGGAAAWLDPDSVPRTPDSCCDFCEEPLRFLLQIYASLEERSDTFHRTLFMFMCSKMECLRRDQAEQKKPAQPSSRSVKVFRSQLPLKNIFYSDTPSRGKNDRPLTTGVDLCTWCRTWRGEKVCGGCKTTRYCSRQHQVEHWRAGHSSSCKTQAPVPTNNSSNTLWPEMEIVLGEEERDEETGNTLPIVPANQSLALNAELQGFEEASGEKQCWANFQARIQRAPSQVLRYCRNKNAKVLWMRPDDQPTAVDISPCQLCGGPLIFEFQVLPQLLYYFGVDNEPDSLDWATLAVYSCSNSCEVEGYAREFIWVQLPS